MRWILFFFLFYLSPFSLLGQTDNLKNEIQHHSDTKDATISKARIMIIENIVKGDKKKVNEILDYLKDTVEDNQSRAFYQIEKYLLYYWFEKFDFVIKYALDDSINTRYVYSHFYLYKDTLMSKLENELWKSRSQIKIKIQSSDLTNTEKDFLILNINYLLNRSVYRKVYNTITQDTLNKLADDFLISHPNSQFENYVRKNIRYVYFASNWSTTFEVFSGYGLFTNKLESYFKNFVPFGWAVDIYRKNFVLYGRGTLGAGKTKDSIPFNNGTWRKESYTSILIPEITFGYIMMDNELLKFSPFIGISSTSISPTEKDINKIPEYEDVGLDLTTTYTMGINVDIKLGKWQPILGKPNWFLRLRYAYNKPNFDWNYSGFNGTFHYVTIGIGEYQIARSKRDY